MTPPEFWMLLGATLAAAGLPVMFLAVDRIRRLVALNVAASGTLLVIVAVGAREIPAGGAADPVAGALALTGIVVTVACTGAGVVLSRGIDDHEAEQSAGSAVEHSADPSAAPDDEGRP